MPKNYGLSSKLGAFFFLPKSIFLFLQKKKALDKMLFFNPKVLFVCFIQALLHFEQSFSHIATVYGCGRELNAHF